MDHSHLLLKWLCLQKFSQNGLLKITYWLSHIKSNRYFCIFPCLIFFFFGHPYLTGWRLLPSWNSLGFLYLDISLFSSPHLDNYFPVVFLEILKVVIEYQVFLRKNIFIHLASVIFCMLMISQYQTPEVSKPELFTWLSSPHQTSPLLFLLQIFSTKFA